MVVYESVRGFLEALVAPFSEFFRTFSDFRAIIIGLLVMSLIYFGWRAVR